MAMSKSDIITLDVGGVVYKTTRATLTKYSDSMFGLMFNENMGPGNVDEHGNVFIDRNGKMFTHVLEFLRSGKLLLPHKFLEKESLLAEAEFYQIQPLIDELNNCCDDLTVHVTRFELADYKNIIIISSNTAAALAKLPIDHFASGHASFELENIWSHMHTRVVEITINDVDAYCDFEEAFFERGWIKAKYISESTNYPTDYPQENETLNGVDSSLWHLRE